MLSLNLSRGPRDPAHCFFPVCGRKSWSGTRGSLGLWSSLPIGLMTANRLLQSTLTSPSSEWCRVGGSWELRGCTFPLTDFCTLQSKASPAIAVFLLPPIHSSHTMLNNISFPGTTVQGSILGRWMLDATLMLVNGM